MKNRVQFLTVLTAVVLLGLVAVAVTFYLTRPQTLEVPSVVGYEGQPVIGNADAPVKVILFENFLCEHCRSFETDVFLQLKREYIDTGEVAAVYINLAWGEQEAQFAALAGECAYQQDPQAFWDFKGQLYEAQGS